MSVALLRMSEVCKSFGANRALDGVSLELNSGEVHALVGENGAGKSTLMRILSGAHSPDSGTMVLAGQPYRPRSPRDARGAGVAMIYQELTIAPHLTVEANILLGQERSRFGLIRMRESRRLVKEALSELDHPEIEPTTLAGSLSVGQKQLVEVARALAMDAKVIVFDEPTSSLTESDAQRLFTLIDKLRERGLAIVYISHFLEEVRRVATRLTVLRDGRSVSSGLVSEMSQQSIIQAMVGRSLDELFPRIPRTIGEPILNLEGLSGVKLPVQANLTLRRGEILGIAGLVGAGRTELLRATFGLDAVRSGRVMLRAIDASRDSVGRRIHLGLGLVSEDRKGEGLALGRSIEDNMTLSALGRSAFLGCLRFRERRREVLKWMERLRVKAEDPGQDVGLLSGGNQQKVALGRLFHQRADIFLLDEPTRGIDIGSKVEIYRQIGEQAAAGKAVLIVSSYLPELFGLCDRLAVMRRGELCPARPIEDWTEHSVMEFATGANAG